MIPWFWVTRQEWIQWKRDGVAAALLRSALVLTKGAFASLALIGALAAVEVSFTYLLGIADD